MGPGEERYQARARAEVAVAATDLPGNPVAHRQAAGPPRQRDRQMGSMRQTPPIKEPRAAKSRGQGERSPVDAESMQPALSHLP